MRTAIKTVLMLFTLAALALSSGVALTFAAAPVLNVQPYVVGGTPTPPLDFLAQVFAVVRAMGGFSTLAKVAGIITLLISSMKVSMLDRLVWSKLGAGQVVLAPLLGLLAGLAGLGASGQPFTLPLVVAYVMAGGGAVFLHEILDALKAIPGLGPVYLQTIALAERLLGGGAVKTANPEQSQEKKAS